jgi:hypothetical protein
MRFYEVDSSVDAIMSAAMVAQTRASNTGKQGKLSMNGFLQMLANAGIMMDYDGFKTVFDTNPQLKNVIAQFNKDEITFVGDSDDEGAGYEEPQGDMPDDERVAKMAQRATKMRTEEFVEAKEIGVYKEIGGVRYYSVKNKSGKEKLFSGPTPAAKKYAMTEGYEVLPTMDRDKYQKRDGLEGPIMTRSGKVVYYDPQEGMYYDPDTDIYIDYDDYKMLDKKANEGELPPHLSKMFGKDGTQVDTRTDVMKQMRDIVDNKSAMEVTFGDGKQMVDMYTASVLVQIYDKVNPENKEKIVQRVGTIEKFTKLMPTLFNMIGEGKSPHKKGTEKYRKHMAAMHAGESVNEAWQAFKERSLTKAEKSKMKHYEKKLPKQDFIDRYGKEQGEAIYYATATKMAKKNA